MAIYLEQSLASLERFEGAIPWMYVDTVGKVTVGVGLMLPNAAAAIALPFEVAGRPATPVEIADEFARVDALPMGRAAQFYRGKDRPELPQQAVADVLRKVLTGFETELRAAVHGYDQLPDSVKVALLDMTYNLGVHGLLHGYPKLMKAVSDGNWAQAAACCHRRGPSAERNEWTRKQFLSNVLGALEAEAEGMLRRFGYGLVGVSAALIDKLRRRQ